ncbi:MAG TPA: ABC transporter permease [Chloroflexia bacterium]|nr:ABC transporter permease [Chloroflexia bacterium]
MARIYFNLANPIATREMKTRVRGFRTFALVGVYLIVLAMIILVIYIRKGANSPYSYGGTLVSGNFGPTRSFETGQDIFITIFLYLSVVVAVVTPALCGGLVSREMEDGTYDMLVVTPLRGRTLIYGKLIAGISYMTLVVLSAFPLACVVFIFGGVNFDDILAGFAIILMEAAVLSIISLFFSGLFRHTSVAVIVTYCIVALLMLGVPVISSSIVASLNSDSGRIPQGVRVDPHTDPAFDLPKRILVFNPVAAIGSVLAPNAPYRPGQGEDLQYFPNSRFFWGKPESYYSTPSFPPGSFAAQINSNSRLPVLPNQIPLWQGYLLVYTAIGLFFLILSNGVIKPLPRRQGINPLRGLRQLSLQRFSAKRVRSKETIAPPPEGAVEIPLSPTADEAGKDSTTAENPGLVSDSLVERRGEALG